MGIKEKLKEWASSLASHINEEFNNNGVFFDFNENPYLVDARSDTGDTYAAELHLGAKSMPEDVQASDNKVLRLFIKDIINDFISKSQGIDDSEMVAWVYININPEPEDCFVQGCGLLKDAWVEVNIYIYGIKWVE